MIIDAGYCFWLGVSFGFGVGAIFVKLVQYATGPRKSKVGTPSASHNSIRNAIPASEAYCRKHAGSKTMSWQRAFLDGVAWREQHP